MDFCHPCCLKLYEHFKIHTYRVHISFKWRMEKDNLELYDDIILNTTMFGALEAVPLIQIYFKVAISDGVFSFLTLWYFLNLFSVSYIPILLACL